MANRTANFRATLATKANPDHYNENWKDQEAVNKASFGNRIISGFAVTDSGGLFIDIAAGEAVIGRHIDMDAATTNVAFPASVTRWVWLKQETTYAVASGVITDTAISVEYTATSTAPAGEVARLARVTSDGSGITEILDLRVFGNIWTDQNTFNMGNGALIVKDDGFGTRHIEIRRAEQFKVKTSDYTILNYETNYVWTNRGASGTVILTLPLFPIPGQVVSAYVEVAHIIRLDGNGATIQIGNTAGATIEASAIGSFIRLVYHQLGGFWIADNPVGQWASTTSATPALDDLGGIIFPAYDQLGHDASLVEIAANSFVAMLFVPRFNIPLRYAHVVKGNADAAESIQGAFYGPVARPVRGTRIITPSTDSPVLLAKSSDTVAPSAIGLATVDVGGAAKNLIAGRAYWVVVHFEEAMNCPRIMVRAMGPGAGTGIMSTAQQLIFIATAGAPTYATNFGTVGAATLAGITWNANTGVPIIGIS